MNSLKLVDRILTAPIRRNKRKKFISLNNQSQQQSSNDSSDNNNDNTNANTTNTTS